jgi:CDGSH-type Zn-finger protein
MKQCVCGRSKTYPYCDNTHKTKLKDIENKKELEKEDKDSSS